MLFYNKIEPRRLNQTADTIPSLAYSLPDPISPAS
ncbi:hypothetical protein Thiosp_00367 [Thiorhodovibrio litoralis]|nr:hypothetical protein Thiosp_00367 [Thiorhodovibrio litoralis]